MSIWKKRFKNRYSDWSNDLINEKRAQSTNETLFNITIKINLEWIIKRNQFNCFWSRWTLCHWSKFIFGSYKNQGCCERLYLHGNVAGLCFKSIATYISSIKIFVAKVWNHQSNIVSCLSNIITVCPPMMPSTPFSDDLLTNQNLCRSAKESLEDDHNKMVVDKDQLPEDKSDTTILCIPVPMHAVVKCKF